MRAKRLVPKIDEREFIQEFIRSSGPGGQNVNKVSTGVRLRFDVSRSPSLDGLLRARLMRLAGRRLTRDGILVITATRFRTQEQNRRDARRRLMELLRIAVKEPQSRRETEPTRASRERRREEKRRRSDLKRLRGRLALED